MLSLLCNVNQILEGTEMALAKELPELNHFIGTEQYHRGMAGPHLVYTDGVRHVGFEHDAVWLFTDIGLYHRNIMMDRKIDGERKEFIAAKLKVDPDDKSAVLTLEDGNGGALSTAHISYTDFPAQEFMVYICNGVIMLPSEY